MEINRTVMKQEAKGLIVNTSPSPILVGLVYVFLVYVLNYLSTRLIGLQVNTNDYYNAMMSGDYTYFQSLIQNYHPGTAASLLNLAVEIMLMILAAGFVIYVLNVVRHYTAGFGNLFDGFGIFFRILWLTILTGIFIFLWSLLLVIPGIIAAYRYRMALYLLLDNPDMSAYQCISESKRMMAGHKGELFVLDLSFLGWYILTVIPFVTIWVTPYTQTTYAVYYDTLRANLGYALPVDDLASGGDGNANK
jgi:hypothetical protein